MIKFKNNFTMLTKQEEKQQTINTIDNRIAKGKANRNVNSKNIETRIMTINVSIRIHISYANVQ